MSEDNDSIVDIITEKNFIRFHQQPQSPTDDDDENDEQNSVINDDDDDSIVDIISEKMSVRYQNELIAMNSESREGNKESFLLGAVNSPLSSVCSILPITTNSITNIQKLNSQSMSTNKKFLNNKNEKTTVTPIKKNESDVIPPPPTNRLVRASTSTDQTSLPGAYRIVGLDNNTTTTPNQRTNSDENYFSLCGDDDDLDEHMIYINDNDNRFNNSADNNNYGDNEILISAELVVESSDHTVDDSIDLESSSSPLPLVASVSLSSSSSSYSSPSSSSSITRIVEASIVTEETILHGLKDLLLSNRRLQLGLLSLIILIVLLTVGVVLGITGGDGDLFEYGSED